MKTRDFPGELEVHWESSPPGWAQDFHSFASDLIIDLGVVSCEASITLCGDETIRTYNRTYRGKDEATDVLSFEAEPDLQPIPRSRLAGDLLISLPTVALNADYFGVTFTEELKRVTLHGILHLLGWDHGTNEPGEPMLVYQENFLNHRGRIVNFEKT